MKTLVAYSTKHGSCEEAARRLAAILGDEAALLDLGNKQARASINLEEYDKVAIGGPVYAGMWAGKTEDFIESNAGILGKKKTWFFSTALTNQEAESVVRNSLPKQLADSACAVTNFGGRIEWKKLNLIERFIMKMVTGHKGDSGSLDDSRIETFASLIRENA